MTGSSLIAKVRRILKDVESSTQKGSFWENREILLALNAAQDIYINYCIENNQHNNLTGLLSTTGFVVSGTPFTFSPSYFHYVSARVGSDESSTKMARIYLGGEGFVYNNAHHWAVVILENYLYFIENGGDSSGELVYYTYPSTITNGSFDDCFSETVYRDLIANYAAVILAIKEIQTQREFKKFKTTMRDLVMNPEVFAWYINNLDLGIGEILKRIQNVKSAQNSGKE